MLEECEGCGTRFAPDLAACPHCGLERAEEDGMAKIIKGAGVSFPEDAVPAEDAAEVRDVAAPAPVDAQAPDAAPEPAPAPRVPPRLTPPEVPGG